MTKTEILQTLEHLKDYVNDAGKAKLQEIVRGVSVLEEKIETLTPLPKAFVDVLPEVPEKVQQAESKKKGGKK